MSKTCSSQLATCPFIVSWIAICSIEFSFVAPCQCSSFGAIQTVSPTFIICGALFLSPTRPIPDKTKRVCPNGWVCQAVRAFGSNDTLIALTLDGSGSTIIGSWNTSPWK